MDWIIIKKVIFGLLGGGWRLLKAAGRVFWEFITSPAGHLFSAIAAAVLSALLLMTVIKNDRLVAGLRNDVATITRDRDAVKKDRDRIQKDYDQCEANRQRLEGDLQDQSEAINRVRAEGEDATRRAQRALAEERRRGRAAGELATSILIDPGAADLCVAADEFLIRGAG